MYGPNQYPSFVPSLEPAIRRWRSLCDSISFSLVDLMAQSLTPSPDLLTSLFATSPSSSPGQPAYSRMKVVQYPPMREGDDGLGVGAHKDGGGLTLLAQDQTGGLQVQLWTGEWIDVEPIPYALVINVGQVVCVRTRLSLCLGALRAH